MSEYHKIHSIFKRDMLSPGRPLMEGVVGRPKVELFTRGGQRIITKIKAKDFIRRTA